MSVKTEIIIPALQDLSAIQPGEMPSDTELADGLALVNLVMGQLGTEKLTFPVVAHGTFLLTANTDSYLMGDGQSWDSHARVLKIIGAAAYSGAFRSGVEVVPQDQFRARSRNPLGSQSTLPEMLAHDNGRVSIRVYVFPTPLSNASIDVDYWTPQPSFALLTDAVSLTPEAVLVVRYALAVAWAPTYGKEISQTLGANFTSAKGSLATLNAEILGPPSAPTQPATQP